ncbi:uncharacterized protein K02A2.6-like [Liolophura sinensis]|uniref:uncharacterized protein K02A2.6-like n=1 Tax=Liolophura sinensis TaxID=3198878 RepID=UPI0031581F8B
MEHLDIHGSVNPKQIKSWTQRDPLLSRVLKVVLQDWPDKCQEANLQPVFKRRTKLNVHNGCLLWGSRAIVPPQGRQQGIQELYVTHPGIYRMKILAKSYVWWPKMDNELEITQLYRESTTSAYITGRSWKSPGRPWSKIHIDYAEPYMGKMFPSNRFLYKMAGNLPANGSTSSSTIEKLQQCFATQGLLDQIVSDNGTSFTHDAFKEFRRRNGINHILTSPYHPASNGQVERAVQFFKGTMAVKDKRWCH